jgi:hypothetical protein
MMVLLVILVGGAAYFFNLQRQIQKSMETPREAREPSLIEEPTFEETAPRKRVALFFPSTDVDGRLETEERDIHTSDEVTVEAKQIIAALIEGSLSGHDPSLPPETWLREVYLTESGLMVVDFSPEAAVLHPGGITREVSSIYSVVNSLTFNLSAVTKVRILIDGAETDTLAGHIDLRRPLVQDLTMTAEFQSEEPMPGSE